MAASRTLFSKGSKVVSGLATVAEEIAGAAAVCSDMLTDGDADADVEDEDDKEEEEEEEEEEGEDVAVSVVAMSDDEDEEEEAETLRSQASIH